MTRSDLVARILPGVLAARWASEYMETARVINDAERIADELIKRGHVVTDAPNPASSDIEQALAHLRKARAAFVLAGREDDAESMRAAIGTVERLRLEIGQ